MAAFNAGASRGMPFAVGFPIFLIPSAIFLGAVSWLNARLRSKPGPSEEPTRLDFAYLEFGLLGFAFLAGVLRTGAVVLQLPPALYAIPAMLLAIAGVSTARAIGPLEKDRRRPLMFQQGGLVFSALAFALALARPPGVSALFSGNTLAVAVLGLALYATSLRATRLPAYLYAGFAALFLAYFGAFYFAKDLVHSVEEAARRAMGYDRPLPAAFKAINGLLFSVGLAGLARFFARRWSDDRLSRHCHYIGLPMSIAACVFSGLEPMAALICLGGYAILYAIGARLYSEPRLIYLACAAMAGSAFFGASMAGASAIGLRSMIASALGLAFWAIPKLPSMVRAGETYRRPLIHAARVMAAFAMVAATIASIRDGMISPLATVAFLLTATLALLNGREAPRTSIYLLALAALLGTWLGGSHLLIGNRPTSLMVYGLIIALFAIVALVAGEVAKVRSVESGSAYLKAMGLAVPVIVFLAWGFAGWERVVDLPVVLAFVVGSVGLLWLTRFRREPALVYSGLVGLAVAVGCFTGLIVPGVLAGDGDRVVGDLDERERPGPLGGGGVGPSTKEYVLLSTLLYHSWMSGSDGVGGRGRGSAGIGGVLSAGRPGDGWRGGMLWFDRCFNGFRGRCLACDVLGGGGEQSGGFEPGILGGGLLAVARNDGGLGGDPGEGRGDADPPVRARSRPGSVVPTQLRLADPAPRGLVSGIRIADEPGFRGAR